MSELEAAVYGWLLAGGAVVLASAWVAVSFLPQGRGRSVIEWVGTVAMYLVIGAVMARLFRRFWLSESPALMAVFGFLCLVFGAGLLTSLAMLVRALAGRDRSVAGAADAATH